MGNCCVLLGLKKVKRPVTLLLVGLDNAGKTTAAKGIVGDSIENVAPTVGFSPETLEYRGCEITIYDLGGGPRIRSVWPRYFSEIHGVIYVIDSSDKTRIEECRSVLEELLSHKKIAGKPVLVLANKQDIEGALDEIDLVENLKIEQIVNSYKCPTRVETCSATAINKKKPDKPIADGFRWLLDTIVVHYDSLHKRVEHDMKEEQQRQAEEIDKRNERIKRYREEREKEERRQQALTAASENRKDSDDLAVIVKQQNGERASKSNDKQFAEKLSQACHELEVHASKSSSPGSEGGDSGGSKDQSKSSSDAQELRELGFKSHPNSLDSAQTLSSTSSPSQSNFAKEGRSISSSKEPNSPRVIQVHPSSSEITLEALEGKEARRASLSLSNLLELESQKDIVLEDTLPLSSECIPMDDVDTFVSKANEEEEEEEEAATVYTSISPQVSAAAVHRSSIAGIKEQLELEASLYRKPKRKGFLKRFHKTAPLESTAGVADSLIVTERVAVETPSGRIP